MFDLDTLIDSEHRRAEQAEHEALAVIEKLSRIPAAQPWLRDALKKRQYGQTVSPWSDGNLTAQAAIVTADRPFAVWLAAKSGQKLPPPNYKAQLQAEAQLGEAERLAAKTAQLRERNAATRQRWEQRRSHSKPIHQAWL